MGLASALPAAPQGNRPEDLSAQSRTIRRFIEALPEKYVVYFGDFSITEKIIDEKNGYAAYVEKRPNRPEPMILFEVAKFNKAGSGAVIVVSNLQYDHVCFDYETFFLTYDKGEWRDVSGVVLPEIPLAFFYPDSDAAGIIRKYANWIILSYRYDLPRYGTTIRVSPVICDYIDDGAPLPEGVFSRILAQKPSPVSLEWKRETGTFKMIGSK